MPSRGTPPAGLLAPQRGFGYVWSTNDNVFAQLGWARQEELGFCALLQSFERGFIIISSSANSCTAEGLYNRANDPGRVRHFALMVRNDGIWRAFDSPAPQPTSAQPNLRNQHLQSSDSYSGCAANGNRNCGWQSGLHATTRFAGSFCGAATATSRLGCSVCTIGQTSGHNFPASSLAAKTLRV